MKNVIKLIFKHNYSLYIENSQTYFSTKKHKDRLLFFSRNTINKSTSLNTFYKDLFLDKIILVHYNYKELNTKK